MKRGGRVHITKQRRYVFEVAVVFVCEWVVGSLNPDGPGARHMSGGAEEERKPSTRH